MGSTDTKVLQKPACQMKTSESAESQFDMLNKLGLDDEAHRKHFLLAR